MAVRCAKNKTNRAAAADANPVDTTFSFSFSFYLKERGRKGGGEIGRREESVEIITREKKTGDGWDFGLGTRGERERERLVGGTGRECTLFNLRIQYPHHH